MAEVKLQKKDECHYEIPKEGKMRVPGIIYADEKLIEAIRKDQSLVQVANVAHLPGIVKASMAMPDIHQGYGFPIGGVAGMSMDGGIISPGGVGYDINCLAGYSRVLHAFGYTLPISEMESSWRRDTILCQDLQHNLPTSTPLSRYIKQSPRAPVCRVVTETGDEITATADHPFLTPEGMVELQRVKEGDRIAMYPFEGVPYEPPSESVIVDRNDILRLLTKHGKGDSGNGAAQILAQLERLGVLPLEYRSPQFPFLLKLLGYAWGDGSIYFTNRTGKGVTWFWGKEDDLQTIRADVEALGFTASRIYTRARTHRIKTFYSHYEFENTETAFKIVSSAFAVLLAALGAPLGNKTSQDFTIPDWLFQATRWQKRLFLAALFGAELTTPKPFKVRNYNFYSPILCITKHDGFVESGKKFMQGLSRLLAEFDVETKTISTLIEGRSHRLRLILSSTPQSLMNLWSTIGFEYNHKRRALANAAVLYLKCKGRVINLRQEAIEATLAMQAAGVAPQTIYGKLEGTYVNRRFLERSLYEGRETGARVSSTFLTFEEYHREATAGLGTSGMVWERIASVDEVPFDDDVYDFTVAHPDHNFVANGFVVSNCGVRLLRSDLKRETIQSNIEDLVNALFLNIPSGVGSHRRDLKLSAQELKKVLVDGARWAVDRGLGDKEDLEFTEEGGGIKGADPSFVSDKALSRGRDQLGTVGSGNHFVEIGYVEEIYDDPAARILGLFLGQITVLVHTGSRGFGYQVCDDYLRTLSSHVRDIGIELPDRQLACAYIGSEQGEHYFKAMNCAVNFAFANRQIIAHWVRESFEQVLGMKRDKLGLTMVYDVAHNIAKREKHIFEGREIELMVHRKGATRAFPAGHPAIPRAYSSVGQPVLIPGDMGRCSYVLIGQPQAMAETFGTVCHGAGRVMSRHQAIRTAKGRNIGKELRDKGIIVKAASREGFLEEIPEAYKDVTEVVECVEKAGLAKKVAKLRPLGVVKG